ncbi:MAG TPA: DUF481 domain-containing protein [Candidatus Eisenbacteria bacterium]|nr:DUF481 domain-containing protein [Candidatus Eisenbacteria bacterium]
MSIRFVGAALTLVLAPAGSPELAFAAKTDLVILRNGDRITGEVKSMSRGKLEFSTDDAGRLSIEWEKIARATSPNQYDVKAASGRRYLGRLAPPDQDGFMVVRGDGIDTMRVESVVEITPVSASFGQRVKAYLDLGFTLAKANRATTFTVSGKVDYRSTTFGSALAVDSYVQGQESVPTTTRNTLRQSASWYLDGRWSAGELAQLEQNEELDLDHRITAGGAMNRVLGQSNQMELVVGAGLVVSQEQFSSTTGGSDQTSVEGLLMAQWEAFRFDSPTLDFGTGLSVFPSFSQGGRVRGQAEFRLEYELFNDFNTGIRFTDTFDSRPLEETAAKNDYVATFTIGWSYRR